MEAASVNNRSIEEQITHDAPLIEEVSEVEKLYLETCMKARKRAERFGMPYQEPDRAKFFSLQQKGDGVNGTKPKNNLESNKSAFSLGVNLSSVEEQEKLAKRYQRFATPEELEAAEKTKEKAEMCQKRAERFGVDLNQTTLHALPLLGLGLEVYKRSLDRYDPPLNCDKDSNVAREAEKLHIFAMDKEAFSCIKTLDVMSYFKANGHEPTYVEWLGWRSCNIHFRNGDLASRCLIKMTDKIPSLGESEFAEVSDEDLLDPNEYGWRMGKGPLLKVNTDKNGTKGTAVRLLFRLATVNDRLLGGKKKGLVTGEKKEKKNDEPVFTNPDLDSHSFGGAGKKRKLDTSLIGGHLNFDDGTGGGSSGADEGELKMKIISNRGSNIFIQSIKGLPKFLQPKAQKNKVSKIEGNSNEEKSENINVATETIVEDSPENQLQVVSESNASLFD